MGEKNEVQQPDVAALVSEAVGKAFGGFEQKFNERFTAIEGLIKPKEEPVPEESINVDDAQFLLKPNETFQKHAKSMEEKVLSRVDQRFRDQELSSMKSRAIEWFRGRKDHNQSIENKVTQILEQLRTPDGKEKMTDKFPLAAIHYAYMLAGGKDSGETESSDQTRQKEALASVKNQKGEPNAVSGGDDLSKMSNEDLETMNQEKWEKMLAAQAA